MAKQENIRATGLVMKSLPNAHFIVRIIDEGFEGHEVNAHISGKMRLNYIKILPGDHVILELTPFDLTKGRIVYRGKEKKKPEEIVQTPSTPNSEEMTAESTEVSQVTEDAEEKISQGSS